jgi:hypothetical protein
MPASVVCWRASCVRRGGNPPAPACTRRGKRERGRSSSLLPQADSDRPGPEELQQNVSEIKSVNYASRCLKDVDTRRKGYR